MYAVIMAGGIGARFWPRSRPKHPKQLLKIIGPQTMIQSTMNRLMSEINNEKIFIVTTAAQVEELRRQIPELKSENLIIEPKGKNTAPCIGLAAMIIKRIDPEAVMAVLPADHYIQEKERFLKILTAAEQVALNRESLVTIGIDPTYPATGYGYIQYNNQIDEVDGIPVYKVKTFAEKPDIHTAERFLDSGDFLWNSGMFIWKVKTILQELEESLPELYDGLLDIEKALGTKIQDEVINKVYCQIKSISIDYGVMEHTRNVTVLKGDFGWSDVGSWDEVYNLSPKDENQNAVNGCHILQDTHRCLIDAPNKLVATVGLKDLIIVDTVDALLVCRRDCAQEVKELVENMKRTELTKYLR